MSGLFEGHDLRTLVDDLRAVKMGADDRARAQALRGSVRWSAGDVGEAWALVRRFRVQLVELHAARERAWRSVGRAKLGLTRAAVARAVDAREAAAAAQRDDLGI